LNISEDAPIEEVLVKLKLLTDRKLTNVAVLLFSRESNVLIQNAAKMRQKNTQKGDDSG
jgi:hypothetical protein